MIINRFFKVNSNEIVIFKLNFKLQYEKFRVFVTFYKNLHTRLRLQQKAAASPAPAPAPQHWFAPLYASEFLFNLFNFVNFKYWYERRTH
jgi:hypothetical protein